MGEVFDNEIYTLIKKAKDGDMEAKTILVEKNTGLVWSIVKRFKYRGHEIEDLFQIGCIGLVRAIKKFDTTYNVKFSTYAVPMIIGEIKRHIRDDGIIKVSRTLKEVFNKSQIAREILSKEFGREPSISEISKHLNISTEEIIMAQETNIRTESLFATIPQSEDSHIFLIDKICGNDSMKENEIVCRIDLMGALEAFPKRERQIIMLRYFRGKTQAAISKMLGISQVQVSRIEKKVLRSIRAKIS